MVSSIRGGGKKAYRKQGRTVHGNLNDLDRGVVARLDGRVGGQRHLGQAHGARVGVLGRPEDLDRADHGEAHVLRAAVRAIRAEAQVHVHEGRRVALEPARLEGDGAACGGPVCPICCCWVATACGDCCQSLLVTVYELGEAGGCLGRFGERGCWRPGYTESEDHQGEEQDTGILKGASSLTWVHPLHAVWECVVRDQVVASPSGVGEHRVRR